MRLLRSRKKIEIREKGSSRETQRADSPSLKKLEKFKVSLTEFFSLQ